jgi:hypothetical protein
LLLVGIIEILTGIHFAGAFTNKLNCFPIGNLTYSPVFLYDNPNNFFVYLSLIGSLSLITNALKKGSSLFQYIYLLSLLYISFVSSVRAGTILVFAICAILVLFFLLKLLRKKFIQTHNKQLLSVCILFLFMILAIAKNNLFWGPIWRTAPTTNIQPTDNPLLNGINEQSTYIPMKYVNKLDASLLDTFFHSNKSRLSLLANGIDMMKKSHYLGVGPGQYRHISATKQQKYYTSTLISPHFWLIEIVSQYGILILLAYLFFIVLIGIKILRFIKKGEDETKILLIALCSFIVCSILPSSFLVLNINWIFFAILVAIVFSLEQLKNEYH